MILRDIVKFFSPSLNLAFPSPFILIPPTTVCINGLSPETLKCVFTVKTSQVASRLPL